MDWGYNNKKLNYLVYSSFVSKVIIFILYNILGEGIRRIQIVAGFEIEIDITHKNIYPLIFFLKKHTLSQCKSIVDIICYDNLASSYRFALIYNMLSIHSNLRVKVISKIQEFWNIPSMIGLFQSVGWYEREIFDFFGVFFILNNDLRRILSDYGFKGHPLRKDFPMSGYVDIYYDDNQKRICYRKLELSQEYRNFKLKTLWV